MASDRQTRWIVIATVKADAQLYGRPGEWRRGFWLNWRGRCDWCQPCEFYEWDSVVSAVQTRLRRAGLEAVSFASCPPALEYQALWVEVQRVAR